MTDELKNNTISDDNLDNVNGGILDSRTCNDKKGLRLRARAGIGATSASQSQEQSQYGSHAAMTNEETIV